ncbi:S26 family signal peptidase [Bythopirellula polymerisocia]|uniref:S26 family signal peptidase n=1 Tax=Bythopirellula polymerisocia TaxID=2528003 RepID=UPI0018D2C0CD|nr:S26 family signal peptidase [Bythopirellula polymerisocia]
MKAHSSSIVTALQLVIGTFVLAIVLRTWLVMGLIEPVTVAGSSMAPTMLGPHLSLKCERCRHMFDVGAEFAVETEHAECPQCGFKANPFAELPVRRGDRLVIDRMTLLFRLPRRWEPVVFVSPADEGGLVVKRVVGLPGEKIQLRDGEVWIDGHLAKKTFEEQLSLRHLIHREATSAQRWQGDGWTWRNGIWNCASHEDWNLLSYVHPQEQLITDDSSYNAGLTRRLFAVYDLSLSIKLQVTGTGELAICHYDGEQEREIRLNPAEGRFELRSGGILLSIVELSPASSKALQVGEVQIEIGVIDQRLLFAIEGNVEWARDIEDSEQKGSGVNRKDSCPVFKIGARGLTTRLRDLRLFRDAFYASREEAASLDEPMIPILLGENEIFVLGDNVPVSIDSRHWGPLPLRFLVGRPLNVR